MGAPIAIFSRAAILPCSRRVKRRYSTPAIVTSAITIVLNQRVDIKKQECPRMGLAVITGAAQGIGRRTAEMFATAGYSLALLDLQPCSATLAGVKGSDAADFPGDLSDEAVVEATA